MTGQAESVSDWSLRPQLVSDLDFLRRLYLAVRWPEVAVMPWGELQKRMFLSSQFDLQSKHYQTHYPGASFDLVLIGGDAVGRLILHRTADDFRVVDISLLPEWRGRGIGAALLTAVLTQAEAAGCSVSLHVDPANPARRLYQRLGFKMAPGGDVAHQRMIWRPVAGRRRGG